MGLGLSQEGTGSLSDLQCLVAFGGQDHGDGGVDLACGELLAAGGKKQWHLQEWRQPCEMGSGLWADVAGLDEGMDIRVQSANEPQAA
jgi:hypothetical protein